MKNVVALLPAHNEEAGIEKAVTSLQNQTHPPGCIVVIADNCTDDTVGVAQGAGAVVFETYGNQDKKAGALNQCLSFMLPVLEDDEYVLVMDADSELGPRFLEVAVERLEDNPELGACGGSFYCRNEDTTLQVIQGNEYARYVREISRRKGARANVLTGAGSLFRAKVLREVQAGRSGGSLPGVGVYKQDALTEDNELTLAVKTVGYKVASPKACWFLTDAPETTRELFAQRLRWRRGAMEDLKSYGLNRVTFIYIWKMVWNVFVSVLSILYIVLILSIVLGGGNVVPNWFWAGVFFIYLADRWWTIRQRSGRAQLVALFFPFEIYYDYFQQVVMGKALWDFMTRSEQKWVPNQRKLAEV